MTRIARTKGDLTIAASAVTPEVDQLHGDATGAG